MWQHYTTKMHDKLQIVQLSPQHLLRRNSLKVSSTYDISLEEDACLLSSNFISFCNNYSLFDYQKHPDRPKSWILISHQIWLFYISSTKDTTYINIQFKFQVNPLKELTELSAVWFCNQKQMPNAARPSHVKKHNNSNSIQQILLC